MNTKAGDGVKIMTTMKNFQILSKIGKCLKLILITILYLGDGAYSEVYKVKRNSDMTIYALKKVSITT